MMARRWTTQEKNQRRRELINLYIRHNKTIGEIGDILDIAESTVFDRMKRLGIRATPERKPHYLNRKYNNSNLFLPELSDKLAEFFGIMLGDGHLSVGQIWIFINNGTDKLYNPYVKKLINSLFHIEPSCCYRKDQNMKNLFISSVDLVSYLKEKGLSAANKVKSQADAPSWIFQKDSYKKYFLRGFFDTDGSVYRIKFGIQMAFCNKSIPLLTSVRKMLLSLDYHPSRISRSNFYLTRKTDLMKYIEEIGFGNPKHFKRAINFKIITTGA